jgi:hypothetical protein
LYLTFLTRFRIDWKNRKLGWEDDDDDDDDDDADDDDDDDDDERFEAVVDVVSLRVGVGSR